MTTPERVREILAADDKLTDDEREALAELFAVAYERFAGRDEITLDNRTQAGVS